MRSTFTGFNTVRSGLFAAQRALDITGHNISNVNTKGFSRQRLNQVQSNPLRLFGGQGTLGTGVDTISITQFRNEFLDFKYRSEVKTQGYWEAKRDGLKFIEAIFNEPSDSGITTVMDELFSSFQELSKNPESQTTRALVRQRGITFTNTVNHMYSQLEKMARDLNFDVETTVTSINAYAEQIALLNEQIHRLESDGSHANDHRDQRNMLVDELSKLVNIDMIEVQDPNDKSGNGKNNKMVLQINGQPLVYHNRVNKLDTSTSVASTFDNQIHMKQVKWANGDTIDTKALSGDLKGLLDLRDGLSAETKGVPYYIHQLNNFVNTFANEVNKIHASAYGLTGTNGVAFFTVQGVATPALALPLDDTPDKLIYNPGNHGAYIPELGNISAKNIKISLDIDADPNKIAASAEANLLPGDGSRALALSQLRHDFAMFSEGKPEDFVKALISNLGVDTQEAIRMTDNQSFLVEQINRQRESIAGVSLDEEMSNMVKFQHAYNASARMVTTMDEMLDTVINKIGLVGR
ncbi:flagellar hook-associated protein FlgK [Alkaliphilus serpentinus]|uniref:Flagellar hook-associated protein 1 n=1 Tax=Alkaliphilus serpentinus TaxID=1482731 RepID=A0A833M661_9FIRM|nr:flagellar hook-associated protein FlgK [Alkaliphilus serpentinus]KAB3526647.1 flagellar hook-associated protein FlgK [Alkaliphilus serpentinus]